MEKSVQNGWNEVNRSENVTSKNETEHQWMYLIVIARVPRIPRRQSVRASRSENSNCDQNIGAVWARTKESKPFQLQTHHTPALTHIVFRLNWRR